jgi:predicted dehydrogenase/threonine dehydrogenase-like Zn-dependent dehydrogenase
MKQVLQHLRTGTTEVATVPAPRRARGHVLIETSTSLVSAGTERMLVEFGNASMLEKARQQPDKVRMVLDKMRTDGVAATVTAVQNKLDQPIPMGYCNVGRVRAVGDGVIGINIGERVASNGKHAEWVNVPENLCAKIPPSVHDEEAAFTVLAAIALQGIRLAGPTLGEAVVVTGLGLIGLLTVQLLQAHGCRVLGLDFDHNRLQLARRFGAEVVDLGAGADPVAMASNFSRGRGVDAVIITASTESSEPMHQAAQMCRKRGRIVLVGVTGLELSRADFYEKELTFQVSCSYGPGRYDPNYEEKGQDYPIGFVRWTEQRNFEAVLDMMADGRLDVRPLISHRFSIDEAPSAYEVVVGSDPSLGILLSYPQKESELIEPDRTVNLKDSGDDSDRRAREVGEIRDPRISVVGAGNYAGAVLLPAFAKAGAHWHTIASSGGVTSVLLGRKFGFTRATTDTESLIADPQANAVIIATRHDTHAHYTLRALEAGKHVFVEKPLALSHGDLDEIANSAERTRRMVMVGFNRRFSPHVQRIAALLKGVSGPRSFLMTVNAGAIPKEHWTQDPAIGGGRLVGEGCHFVDLLRFLAGSPISSHQVTAMDVTTKDSFTITLRFTDGSKGTIVYVANGSKSFPKERLEVFVAGRVLQLDNFRRLKGYGWPGFRTMNLWRQDKGQVACAKAFLDAIRSGDPSPIPLDELLEVGNVTLRLAEALQ